MPCHGVYLCEEIHTYVYASAQIQIHAQIHFTCVKTYYTRVKKDRAEKRSRQNFNPKTLHDMTGDDHHDHDDGGDDNHHHNEDDNCKLYFSLF